MKNLHKVLALLLCLCLLSACGAADTSTETDRAGADADLGSFTLGRAESADGRYYAEANTDEPTVRIRIYDSADGKELFSFDSVRRLDYWGLCWETNTNNLWVQSGDVGLVCYAFRDGEWVLYPDAVRPPEIVSKYDADPTGTVLPIAVPTIDPEAVGSKGFYCIIHTPDGVERLVSGERAGELYQLFSAGRDKGEKSISLSQPSDVLVLRFYQRSEDLSRLAYGAEYYAAYPDDTCIYAETTITPTYARGFVLPKGSYRDVLELAAGLPTLDEALAECVRARPSGGDGTYTYDLFDFGQNRVQSVGPFSTPLSVYPLTDVYGHLIVLRGSAGPERSAQWSVYYDPIGGVLSESFCNVLMETPEMILCGELDGVGIYEPMSGELFNRITDFSEPLAPTADSPFLSAEISASGLLVVRYLAGEDYHEVSDRYAMTSMSSQKLGYRLVTGDTSPEKDVVPQLGDSLGDLRRTLDWRLNTGSVGHLAWWENSSDYTVVISRNGNTISGYARFSKDGKLLEEAGLQTIPDFDPEEWEGKPFDEFAAQFGACHADLGSGLFIPIYLSDTGKCYTLTVYADTIQLIGGTDVFSSYTLPVSALTETSAPGKTGPVPTPAPTPEPTGTEEFRKGEGGTVVAPDGTEYRFLANEGILYYVGELEFQGYVEGEASELDHLGLNTPTGMFAVKGDAEHNILIRVYPDSEWFAVYRKASLPELDFTADNCSRLEFVSTRQMALGLDAQLLNGNGITGREEVRTFLSELRAQKTAEEAGLYDMVRQPDGHLLNCKTPGAVCGFFEEEPFLCVPLYVTSYNDLAWSVRLDGVEYVLPEKWIPILKLDEISAPAPASAETEETAGVNWEEYVIAATLPPRVEPTSDIEPKHGDSLYSLRQQLDGHLIAESFFHLAWENKSDYVVVVSKNGSTVSGYARFSKDGELLEENGLRTIPDFDPDEWVGRPFDEFTAQFGACHVNIGSGFSIPTYISGTGKIYYLYENKDTIDMIGACDLTAPET